MTDFVELREKDAEYGARERNVEPMMVSVIRKANGRLFIQRILIVVAFWSFSFDNEQGWECRMYL